MIAGKGPRYDWSERNCFLFKKPITCGGDLNGDGTMDASDASLFYGGDSFSGSDSGVDLNEDGVVDDTDTALF